MFQIKLIVVKSVGFEVLFASLLIGGNERKVCSLVVDVVVFDVSFGFSGIF